MPFSKLIDAYQKDVSSGELSFDTQQAAVIETFQALSDTILKQESPNLLHRLFHALPFKKNNKMRGIYLWGTVGSGKTYLMDLFYQNLPIKRKLRIHFHHFMKSVHDSLSQLQGKSDPLRIIARHFSMQAQILCFDEFVVNDIVDAMLLGRLFQFLFERGVVLVATSNRIPDELYWEGLQREEFLPAIELIKQHCQVISLSSQEDYRWRTLTQAGVYFTPINEDTKKKMQQCFELYAHGSDKSNLPLIIEQRPISTISQGKNVVWFDFKALCAPPRSQVDYLAISTQFPVVFISNLPVIAPDDDATACYWIELIDILYDNETILILSADTPLSEIYPSGRKQFEFERTLSRLIEMQSQDYLQKCQKKQII